MTQTDADQWNLHLAVVLYTTCAIPIWGLLLFSEREQFVMTGGQAGVITPTTNIRSLSRFEMDLILIN